MSEKTNIYGGQAVVEGVMFGGSKYYVTAIRRKDNSIDFYEVPRKPSKWSSFKKIPFIRGIVALVEASANGSKHLNFAAERYELDPSEDSSLQQKEDKGSKFGFVLGVAVVGVLSLIFGKLIFTGIPAFLAGLLDPFLYSVPGGTTGEKFLSNIIEGIIKLAMLLIYLFAISQTPLIKRLFQYHGAEHKVINAFEAGKELTVANVQAQSPLHYRCGSSFIIFTVLVGVFIYSLFNAYLVDYDTLWERVYQRLLLIPLVIGVSYETLQFTNGLRDVPILRFLGYPGLWLQKLTTKEPTDQQVEVSIASFNRMRELEKRA